MKDHKTTSCFRGIVIFLGVGVKVGGGDDTDLISGSHTFCLKDKFLRSSSVKLWENWQIYLKCHQHGGRVSDATK